MTSLWLIIVLMTSLTWAWHATGSWPSGMGIRVGPKQIAKLYGSIMFSSLYCERLTDGTRQKSIFCYVCKLYIYLAKTLLITKQHKYVLIWLLRFISSFRNDSISLSILSILTEFAVADTSLRASLASPDFSPYVQSSLQLTWKTFWSVNLSKESTYTAQPTLNNEVIESSKGNHQEEAIINVYLNIVLKLRLSSIIAVHMAPTNLTIKSAKSSKRNTENIYYQKGFLFQYGNL